MYWLKKILKSQAMKKIAAIVIYGYIRLVHGTTRWHYLGERNNVINYSNAIYAFWHGRLAMMPYMAPEDSRMNVISSGHRDGVIISMVMRYFGFNTIFVSRSSSPQSAVRAMLRCIKNGESIAFTPDGSRGPLRQINGNIIDIARLSGVPIIPIGYNTKCCKVLNTWDKFMLPLPFSKGVMVLGDPIYVPKNSNPEQLSYCKTLLKEALDKVSDAKII
jgi:lysophospholipid acyltransferase (LPLAT)-like uncharacterized protein